MILGDKKLGMEINKTGQNSIWQAQNAVGQAPQHWNTFTSNVDTFTKNAATGNSACSAASRNWLEKIITAPINGFSKLWNGLRTGESFVNPTNGNNNFIAQGGECIGKGIKSILNGIGVSSAQNITPSAGRLPFLATAFTLGVCLIPGVFKTIGKFLDGDIKDAGGEASRTATTGLSAALTGAAVSATGVGAIGITVGTILGGLIGSGIGKAIFQRTTSDDIFNNPNSYYRFNNGYEMPYMPINNYGYGGDLPPIPVFGRQGPTPIRQFMMQQEAMEASQPYGNGIKDQGYMKDLNTYVNAIT